MPTYMKNTVLIYDEIVSDQYQHMDYTSRNFTKLVTQIKDLPSNLFEWYQMKDNDKMERVSYELYGTTDYWDLLILINDLDALFGMPYSYDIYHTAANETVNKYIANSKSMILPDTHIQYMHDAYEDHYAAQNERGRTIKIVKPSKLQEFLRKCYDLGYFK